MNLLLNELERQYREQWTSYSPVRCREFAARVYDRELSSELLVRLLCADLELFRTSEDCSTAPVAADEDDDERVRPCVALFLIQFPELQSNPLGLERLAVLEFALRIQHDGERPAVDSYVAICPSSRLQRNLEEAEARLLELKYQTPQEDLTTSQIGKSHSTVPQSTAVEAFVAPRVPFTLGQFLLIRYIGRGGMGFVYAAIDLSTTAQVAIKMMRRGDGWSVFRFVEEFNWLSQLSHPNLVRLYAAFSEGDARYFSMEMVDGSDIRHWYQDLKSSDPDHFAKLEKMLGQMASAIHFLHSQGVIHRDIKCSNVMITSRGRAVLLDLGLAIRQSDQVLAGGLIDNEAMPGTFAYMSPEAFNNQSLTAASDWYSFGVTLFELLSDAQLQVTLRPTDRDGMMRQAFQCNADRLTSLAGSVPAHLISLCERLLAHDPHARPVGTEVLCALGVPTVDHTATEPHCIGREAEAEELLDISQKVANGASANSLIVLSGEAGSGKSRLLNHFLGQLADTTWHKLSIRSFRQDHTPHRLLTQIIQELLRRCSQQDHDFAVVLQQYAQALSTTFPQVVQLLDVSIDVGQCSTSMKYADGSITALLAVITKISQRRPVVIVVDDAQWTDELGLRSLLWLLSNQSEFRGLILLATNSTDSLLSHAEQIAGLGCVQRIAMRPLTESAGQAILQQWCGEVGLTLSPAEINRLTSLGKGNPFLLRQLFQMKIDDQFTSSELADRQLSMQRVVSRRFTRMPRQADLVLQYLAVAAQPLYLQHLISVCRLSARELQASLNILAHQSWILIKGDHHDTSVELASESFREAVLTWLPEERLQRRHYRLAKSLSNDINPPWARISYHYRHAGSHRLAAACSVEAAREAFAQAAFQDALFFIEQAAHQDAQRSPREEMQLQLLRANCHAALGQTDQAAEILMRLAAEDDDQDFSLTMRYRAGDQMLRAGKATEGMQLMRGGLQQLGVSANSNLTYMRMRNGLAAWVLAGRTNRNLTSDAPGRSVRSDATPWAYEHLYRSIIPLWSVNHTLANSLISRLLSQATVTTNGQAVKHSLLSGLLLSHYGERYAKNAASSYVQGLRLHRISNDPDSRAQVALHSMVWCKHRGALRNMHQHAQRLTGVCRSNCSWERHYARWCDLHYYWFDGQFSSLIQEAESLRSAAGERSSLIGFWGQVFPAIGRELTHGNVDQARQSLDDAGALLLDSAISGQPKFYWWLSRTYLLMYEGDFDAAHASVQSQWRSLQQSGVLELGLCATLAYLVRLNLCIVKRSSPAPHANTLKEFNHWIRQLRRLPYSTGRLLSDAYQTLSDAWATGTLPDPGAWQQTQTGLRRHGWSQIVRAINWHLQRLNLETTVLLDSPESSLELPDHYAAEQLLNLLVPLPGYER